MESRTKATNELSLTLRRSLWDIDHVSVDTDYEYIGSLGFYNIPVLVTMINILIHFELKDRR
jgi:hypothetical protein